MVARCFAFVLQLCCLNSQVVAKLLGYRMQQNQYDLASQVLLESSEQAAASNCLHGSRIGHNVHWNASTHRVVNVVVLYASIQLSCGLPMYAYIQLSCRLLKRV